MPRAFPTILLLVALLPGVAGCGRSEDPGNAATELEEGAAGGASAPVNDADAAALAAEAAADEAADTNMFGGNAAAGETGNGV